MIAKTTNRANFSNILTSVSGVATASDRLDDDLLETIVKLSHDALKNNYHSFGIIRYILSVLLFQRKYFLRIAKKGSSIMVIVPK